MPDPQLSLKNLAEITTKKVFLAGEKLKLKIRLSNPAGKRRPPKRKVKIVCPQLVAVPEFSLRSHADKTVKFKAGESADPLEIKIESADGASLGAVTVGGLKLLEKPEVEITSDAPSGGLWAGETISLSLKVTPRALKKVTVKAKCADDILDASFKNQVALFETGTLKVHLKEDLTGEFLNTDLELEAADPAKVAPSTAKGKVTVSVYAFPQFKFADPPIRHTPALTGFEDKTYPVGEAKIALERVDGAVLGARTEFTLSLDEPALNGRKSKSFSVAPGDLEPDGKTLLLDVELSKAMEHTSQLSFSAKKRCRDLSSGAPELKVVPPELWFVDDAVPCVIKDGDRAELVVKASCAVARSVRVKAHSDVLGSKAVTIGKGQQEGKLSFKAGEEFEQPQVVTLDASADYRFKKNADGANTNQRTVQRTPRVVFDEAWIEPATGPYRPDADTKLKFRVKLTGPAPAGGANAKLTCPAFAAPVLVTFDEGEGTEPAETAEVELKLPAGEHVVKLEAGDADPGCRAVRLTGKKAKRITVSGDPAGQFLDEEEWISPVEDHHAGDTFKVKVSLNSTPASGKEAKLKITCAGLEQETEVVFTDADAGDALTKEVELKWAKSGKQTLELKAPYEGCAQGNNVKKRISVKPERTFSLNGFDPKGRLYHTDKTKVRVKLSEKATKGEVIGKLKLTHGKGGEDFDQAEVPLRSLEGEDVIEAEVRVDSPGLVGDDKLVVELVRDEDAVHGHELGSKEKHKKRELKVSPLPSLELAAQPFKRKPTFDKAAKVYVFSAGEQAEVTASLKDVAPQGGARAKLTCGALFKDVPETADHYVVTWEPGQKTSAPVTITVAADAAAGATASLKVEPLEHEHDGLTEARCRETSSVPIKVGEQAKVDLWLEEGFVLPDGPLMKTRAEDRPKVKLKLSGKWPHPAGSGKALKVFLNCSAFKARQTVEVVEADWTAGFKQTDAIELTKTVRTSITLELFKPGEGDPGHSEEAVAYALGANAKREHEVVLPKVYFASRAVKNTFKPAPSPFTSPGYVAGDKATVKLKLSKVVTRPEDDKRTKGRVLVAVLESEHFGDPDHYDVKVNPGAKTEVEVEVTFDKALAGTTARKADVVLSLPEGDGQKAAGLGKTKHLSITIKPPPGLRFDNTGPVKLIKEKGSKDKIGKNKAAGEWDVFAGDTLRARLHLSKKAGQSGAGAVIRYAPLAPTTGGDLFPPDDKSQHREVDAEADAPGGENLPEARYGQTYTLKKPAGELVPGWEPLVHTDLREDTIVRYYGAGWEALDVREGKREVVVFFPPKAKRADVRLRLVAPGKFTLELAKHFCSQPHKKTEHLTCKLNVKDGVVRLPDADESVTVVFEEVDDPARTGEKRAIHFLKGAALKAKEAADSSIVAAEGTVEAVDLAAKEITVGDFKGDGQLQEGQLVYVEALDPIGRPKVVGGQPVFEAYGKVTAIKDPVSWAAPEGPYAVRDVVAFRAERLKSDLPAKPDPLPDPLPDREVLAVLTSKAFARPGQSAPAAFELGWLPWEKYSDPLRVLLMRRPIGKTFDVKVKVKDGVTDYTLRGQGKRKVEVGKSRMVHFARRHFQSKPTFVLGKKGSLTVALSSPAQRKLEVLLVARALPKLDPLPARFAHRTDPEDQRFVPVVFEEGDQTQTVELTFERSFPSGDEDSNVVHLVADRWEYWVAFEGDDDDAAPKFAADAELKRDPAPSSGALTYKVEEVLASKPTAGAPHLYLLSGLEGNPAGNSEAEPPVLAWKLKADGPGALAVKSAQPLFAFPAGEVKGGKAEVPIELKVPQVAFSDPPFKGNVKQEGGHAVIGRKDTTQVGLVLDEASPVELKVKVRSLAFGLLTGGLGKTIEITIKKDTKEAWSDEVALDPDRRHLGAPQDVELVAPTSPTAVYGLGAPHKVTVKVPALPGIRFPRATKDSGALSDEPWVDPLDGEVAVNDTIRFRVKTSALPETKIAKARLLSAAFDAVPFDFPTGGSDDWKWVEATVKTAKKGKLTQWVRIAAKADCLVGTTFMRAIRVHPERKVYFTAKPVSLKGEAADGWKVEWKAPAQEVEAFPAGGGGEAVKDCVSFVIDKDGGPKTERELEEFPSGGKKFADEPDRVVHPETREVLYEVTRPAQRFVPGDKVRLSVYLAVPAPKGGASVTLSGDPLSGSTKAEFKKGQQLLHQEVELGGDAPKAAQVELKAPQNCALGKRKSFKVLSYLPQVGFATPGVEPQVCRGNTLAWINVELDQPAPLGGATVKLTWSKDGAPSNFPFKHPDESKPLTASIAQGRKHLRLSVRIKESLPEEMFGEWKVVVDAHEATLPPGLASCLKLKRCKQDPDRKETTVQVRDAPKVLFAEEPIDALAVAADPSYEVATSADGSTAPKVLPAIKITDPCEFVAGEDGKDVATLRIQPSEEPEVATKAFLRSKAFGPRSYVITLPAGKTDPVEQRVQFVRGLSTEEAKAKKYPFPILLVPGEGWQADEDKRRLLVPVKLPAKSEPEAKCPLKETEGTVDLDVEDVRRQLEPDEESCNLHRMFLIEAHGDAGLGTLDAPGRGADGQGTFEVVRRADHAAVPGSALECSAEPARFQVIAGRERDARETDEDTKFHRTHISVQLSKCDYWCDQEFFEGSAGDEEHEPLKPTMHPFLSVKEKVDKKFIPLLGKEWRDVPDLPANVRGNIQPSEADLLQAKEGKADRKRQMTVWSFPVHQAHHFWHETERHELDTGVKGKLAKSVNWVGNKLKALNPADNILSLLSFVNWRPKEYLVEMASCGNPNTSPVDAVGPVEVLKAIVEVYPSDEFCFNYQFSTGSIGGSYKKGYEGKYYDPDEGIKKVSDGGGQGSGLAKAFLTVKNWEEPEGEDEEDEVGGWDPEDPEPEELEGTTSPGAFLLESSTSYELDEAPEEPNTSHGSLPSLVFHPYDDQSMTFPWDAFADDEEEDEGQTSEFTLGDWAGETTTTDDETTTTLTREEGSGTYTEESTFSNNAFKGSGFENSISLTRNGKLDPVYYGVVKTVLALRQTAQDLAQATCDTATNFTWAYGFQMLFELKFLEGNLSFYWGMKEWTDHRVFRWYALSCDLTLISFSFGVTFGINVNAAFVKFSAMAYFKLTAEATFSTSIEKREPGLNPLTSVKLGETWVGAAVKAEGGVKVVLVHENVFSFNAALRTGLKAEFRMLNLEQNPFGIEYRGFFLGVSFMATMEVVTFKAIDKEIFIIRASSAEFPLFKGVFPRSVAKGFGFLRRDLNDAWKKAAVQRSKILSRLENYQQIQLYLVKAAKVHTVQSGGETVSKFLQTEDLPGYKFTGDVRDSDYQEGLDAWTENKELWDKQWETCREYFSRESGGHGLFQHRFGHLPANLEKRLNRLVDRADARWDKLRERVDKLDGVLVRCHELGRELDEASDKSDKGEEVPDEALRTKVKALAKDRILKWEGAKTDLQVGALRHPLLKFDDVCRDLLYYAKKRKAW